MTKRTLTILQICKHKEDIITHICEFSGKKISMNTVGLIKYFLSECCNKPVDIYTNFVIDSIIKETVIDFIGSYECPSEFLVNYLYAPGNEDRIETMRWINTFFLTPLYNTELTILESCKDFYNYKYWEDKDVRF